MIRNREFNRGEGVDRDRQVDGQIDGWIDTQKGIQMGQEEGENHLQQVISFDLCLRTHIGLRKEEKVFPDREGA